MLRAIYFAIILTICAVDARTCLGRSLEQYGTELSSALKKRDAGRALTSLSGAAARLAELYRISAKVAAPAKTVVREVSRGVTAFSGDAIELAALQDMISKDIDAIKNRSVNMPSFKNPSIGIPLDALESDDPAIRGRALDNLRETGIREERSFRESRNRVQNERNSLRQVHDEARKTVQRGIQIETILKELNEGPYGSALNLYGQKLIYMFLDISLEINPSLVAREQEIKKLLLKYDEVLQDADTTLERYRELHDWSGFYRWQDWIREQIPFDGELAKAERLINEIGRLEQHKPSREYSDQARAIAQLLEKTIRETNVTREQARQLILAAHQKDARAAARAEFSALMSLVGSVTQFSSGAPGVMPGKPSTSSPVPTKPPMMIPRGMRFGPVSNDEETFPFPQKPIRVGPTP